MARKIFNLDNLSESKIVTLQTKKTQSYTNSISACGCLIYKIENNKVKLLLIKYSNQKKNNKLDDFGGKVDDEDNSVFETIARETSEETNNLISKKYVFDKIISNEYTSYYTSSAKYYFIAIQCDSSFYPNTRVFGKEETYEKIPREIRWFDYVTNKKKLANRLLNNKNLVEYLDCLVIKCVARKITDDVISTVMHKLKYTKL